MIGPVCPSCHQTLLTPADAASDLTRCPHCRSVVMGVARPALEGGSEPTVALPPAPTPSLDGVELPVGLLGLFSPPQAPGEIGHLGGFCILGLLGYGGMGAVLEAEDRQLQRRVALKVILPSQADGTARKRFLREARAAAAIDHPNVVPIFQVGEVEVAGAGPVPFLTMPLLRGETLEARLQREGKLPSREVIRIGAQVAAGLSAAHENGLVHRDVKPGNVWLEEAPTVHLLDEHAPAATDHPPLTVAKLLDFGLARGTDAVDDRAPAGRGEPGDAGITLTQAGSIVGTPSYMSPEQVRGRADARSDLFSLGCLLYHMATGRLPFQGPTTMDTLLAITHSHPPAPILTDPTVPAALSRLIMRLLAKDPAERPSNAWDLARRLKAIVRPHRATTVLMLGIISLLLLVGFLCYGVPCVLGATLGGLGWWMGRVDLRQMDAGIMDRKGYGSTTMGYVCSIVGTVLNGLIVLLCGTFIALVWTSAR